jgi:integrase
MGTWFKTEFKGVRYRKHPERKHGVKMDRYYVLTYKWKGKTVTEAVGWASEGVKPSAAYDTLSQLKRNQKRGKGPCTLAEMREQAEEQREVLRRAKIAQAKKDISFKTFFDETFFPDAKAGWSEETARKAREHVKNWIHPVTGDAPMRELDLTHVQRIKENLAGAPFVSRKKSKESDKQKKRPADTRKGRSARQIQYVFRTFTQVWNTARDFGIVDKPCPTTAKSFRLPKVDNERQRYLTLEEENRLLQAIRARSPQVHDMALVSLDAGLRFKEVARLVWGWVDLENGVLKAIDSKGKDRYVPLTKRLIGLFERKEPGGPSTLLFPDTEGKAQKQVPSSFIRAVRDEKLNEEVTNPKMRVSYHTLRHTYASRLIQSGADLYKVQRLLGHGTPVMTARYSKLSDENLRDAVAGMERNRRIKESNGRVVSLREKGGA